jgi:signal transduction histidine kinase
MSDDTTGRTVNENDRMLAYVADLELEVDRLRRQAAFLEREATRSLLQVLQLCTGPAASEPLPTLAEVEAAARRLVEIFRDLHDAPGYHPAHDQVVSVAVRPLAEQVFRWQRRLTGARAVKFRLELDIDNVEWFPVRLRHILDNLIGHAMRFYDPAAPDPWVSLGLRATPTGYELRVSDNGNGPPPGEDRRMLDLFFRAAPIRETGLGAGLSVVKLLVEQSGGKVVASPRPGRGTDFLCTLPRYDLLDYLEHSPDSVPSAPADGAR